MHLRRLGRTTRLLLAAVAFILIFPIIFMIQLESVNQSNDVDRIPIDSAESPKKIVRITRQNVSLHPVMSQSLGNYEPKDLPKRSGPGEGGK